MIVFLVYSLGFLFLINYNGFFGLFKDGQISKRTISLFFLGKMVAVPVFYLLYEQVYGGINNFDTGKFYNDVRVITRFAKEDPLFYLRLLLGMQNDTPGSYDFENCLKYTVNWDNGTVKDFLYNDNRVVIRSHSLLDFISFGSYLTHSLFNCFLSFTGIFFLYRTFKSYFVGKEIWFLIIVCFFPALWFYTGGLLKEGLCVLVMGGLAFTLRKLVLEKSDLKNLIIALVCLYVSFLLKPYLLLFFAGCVLIFFVLEHLVLRKSKVGLFFTIMFCFAILASTLSLLLKEKTLISAALEHQQRFEAVSHGGVFLTDSLNYMQLPPDTNLIKRSKKKNSFTICRGVSYKYWKPGRSADTLYCKNNADTLSVYQLVYFIPKSGSNIQLNKTNGGTLLFSSLYYCLFHPFYFNASGPLQILASTENLCVVLALFMSALGLIKGKKERFLPCVFLFFALGLCVLIGISAPNSGAIFRYRAPGIIFLLLSALYYYAPPFLAKAGSDKDLES